LAAAIEDQKQALERELRLHDLEMRKLMMVAQSASVELAHYDASEAQIERSMDECKSEIEALKQELRNEKIVRRHREEYEALAKAATARQPRQKTEQRVQSLESEVATVTAKELRVRKDLQLREKQFHLVVQSVFNLQSSIAEDGSIEEGLIENPDEAIGEDGDSGDAAVTTMDTSL
jgi:THO complex subunit 7